jgi:ankyrin repeat protein
VRVMAILGFMLVAATSAPHARWQPGDPAFKLNKPPVMSPSAAAASQSPGLSIVSRADRVDFARDVQPIFKQYCYGCHGGTVRQSGFRLDRRSDAMHGGTVAVIGPGNSAGSRMYLRLTGAEYGPQMPPTGALSTEHIETIRNWIDQGAAWPDELSGETPPPPTDPTALRAISAIRSGDDAAFRTLVAGNSKLGTLRGPGGSTPLMYAVLDGNAAAVKLLLASGADPNSKNDAGATALMWVGADAEKTRLLLEHGAAVNVRSDTGRTPLIIAAGLPGAAGVVKQLLDHGAEPSAKASGLIGNTTPLAESVSSGDEAVFRLLMERGADVNGAGPGTLGLALRAQCLLCVEMLLEKMNPALVTPTMLLGGPPLGPALATNLLLAHGADAHAKDPAGRTMLMLAAASDELPVDAVKALLENGADVNAKSANGDTALKYAMLRGNTPIVDVLKKAGAADVRLDTPVLKPMPAASPRAAVERVLPLLQQNDVTFLKKSGCVSCHNNTFTALSVALARSKGVRVDEAIAGSQVRAIGRYVESWRERALQGIGIPGDDDTISYILLGLAAESYPADESTDAMARFLKRRQVSNGQWRILAHRPPIESSDIQVTAASMRSLQLYAPRLEKADYQHAIRRAAEWLVTATPRGTEDRAFQLLGLGWSAATTETIQKAGRALAAEQRPDGGWAQIPTLPSDAYATGQTLVALQQSGALTPADPVVQRGVRFLIQRQLADGSWFVKSRAIPLQPHFESGFPHGRDQFISAAATNWATMALSWAIE